MKKIILLNLFLISASSVYSQQLDIDETIKYINQQLRKYCYWQQNRDSTIITISEFGYINMYTLSPVSRVPFQQRDNDFTFNYKKVKFRSRDNNKIQIIAETPCIQSSPNEAPRDFAELSYKLDMRGIEKVLNAFNYLLEILKYDTRYNKIDDDPFALNNYKKKVVVNSKSALQEQSIKLTSNGSLSIIKVGLCGILSDMILDSGASDVSISETTETELINKKLIIKANYLPSSLYKLADGSVVKSRRFVMPFITVGSFTVKDVICNVNPTGDILLLGKSFLNRFSKWTLDNDSHSLILKK